MTTPRATGQGDIVTCYSGQYGAVLCEVVTETHQPLHVYTLKVIGGPANAIGATVHGTELSVISGAERFREIAAYQKRSWGVELVFPTAPREEA